MGTTDGGQTVVVSLGSGTSYRTAAVNVSDVKAGSKVEVQLAFGGDGQPRASGAGAGPIGTAGSVTVIP